jgi:hypothetical protein
MKTSLKRIIAFVLVLALSFAAFATVVSAAPVSASAKTESASIGSFFKKLADAIKGFLDKIFNKKPDPKPEPEPDTTEPAQSDSDKIVDDSWDFVDKTGDVDYIGGVH